MEILALEVRHQPAPFFSELAERFRRSTHRIWLVGGAARSMHTGEPVADYDFVFGDMDSAIAFRKYLGLENRISITYPHQGDKPIGEDYRYSGNSVQLKFGKFYAEAAEQLDSADFTVCQFYYAVGAVDPGESRFGATPAAINDASLKRLRLHRLTQPAGTLARIPKFIARGYLPESNVSFYRPLVEEIRFLPYDANDFEPIRKAYPVPS